MKDTRTKKDDIMAAMKPDTLVGQVLHARDGGLHRLFDRTGFDRIQAQEEPGGKAGTMEVRGVAYEYGMVGYFPFFGAVRVAAGAIIEAPGTHRKYRDIMGLYSHSSSQVLARKGNNTMDVIFGEDRVEYRMRLNPADSLARDVWARLMREDINASSIGFYISEGDWVEGYDNSLDADPDEAEKIDIFEVTEAVLIEVSLVAQGAFGGATSYPAERNPKPPVGAVAVDAVTTGLLTEEVGGLFASSETDAIVEADDEQEQHFRTEPEAVSANIGGSDTGDVGGSGSQDFDRPEQDGSGNATAEGKAGSADGDDRAGWLKDQKAMMSKRGIVLDRKG